ncbi:helix-turn-helix transcriptional regulator [Bengtsoniella intestinalis]|uniref:helix-turn-helix domain-containing protein n=1 Tax=Bengtsoniella intestinalis TaxID=3073143 RepID=UPI00391F4604
MLKEALAVILRQTRKDKGWTQEQAAEKCGISDRSIRDVEHGSTNLKIDTVEKICSGIGVIVTLQGLGDNDA